VETQWKMKIVGEALLLDTFTVASSQLQHTLIIHLDSVSDLVQESVF